LQEHIQYCSLASQPSCSQTTQLDFRDCTHSQNGISANFEDEQSQIIQDDEAVTVPFGAYHCFLCCQDFSTSTFEQRIHHIKRCSAELDLNNQLQAPAEALGKINHADSSSSAVTGTAVNCVNHNAKRENITDYFSVTTRPNQTAKKRKQHSTLHART